jgi:hypothetical protein
MSIRASEQDENDTPFYEKYFSQPSQSKDSRTIWGFLCFDSLEKGYFDKGKEDEFIDTAYIIADILSLYLMTLYNYLNGSKTFKKAEDVIILHANKAKDK